MRPAGRAEHVVRRVHARHPVAERLVDRVFEGARAVFHRHHSRAELFHPENIGPLPRHVLLAHIDRAGEAEAGGHRRRSHAVLARAGLSDDPLFAHPPDQQPLAHDVVGLVRAGVVEVFPLDVNPRPAEMIGEIFRKGQRRGPAGIIGHQVNVFLPERGICPSCLIRRVQLNKGLMQHFRDERPAPLSEVSFFHSVFLCRQFIA